jgi:hypothetical protein
MWRLPFSAEAPYYRSYGLLFLLPAGEIKKIFQEIVVKMAHITHSSQALILVPFDWSI